MLSFYQYCIVQYLVLHYSTLHYTTLLYSTLLYYRRRMKYKNNIYIRLRRPSFRNYFSYLQLFYRFPYFFELVSDLWHRARCKCAIRLTQFCRDLTKFESAHNAFANVNSLGLALHQHFPNAFLEPILVSVFALTGHVLRERIPLLFGQVDEYLSPPNVTNIFFFFFLVNLTRSTVYIQCGPRVGSL